MTMNISEKPQMQLFRLGENEHMPVIVLFVEKSTATDLTDKFKTQNYHPFDS